MANHLFGGYNSATYGGAGSNLSGLYSSAADQYHPGDSTSLLGATTARYLPSDPYSSAFSSSFPSLADRSSLYSDYLSGGYSAAARAAWPGPPGVEAGSSFPSVDAFAGYKRPSAAEALYRQTLLGTNSSVGQSDAWYATNALAKRPRFEFGSNLPIYPQRPGEKDCAHYMLTRTCKFGESCKFDHPIWVPEGGIPDWKEVPLAVTSEVPPERPGEPDCPYFIKTQKCKFGPRCKFNHPKEIVAPSGAENADPSQLPQRPSEPPCAFYTKTGNCKFGASCKFHHPKDIVIPSSGQVNGTVNEEAFKNVSVMPQPIATPASLHNSKGLPVRPGEVDCPFYLKTGSCKYGATCRYNHPDIYATNPPAGAAAFATTPAAHLNFGVVNPAASMIQSIDPRLNQPTLGLGQAIYPQRPGQIECDFYMKSGECKFGERCKFHHPINRFAHTQLAKESQQENVKLTLAGLPRREGAVHCPYYMKTGACKYGATCKFDHPPPGEVMSAATTGASAAVVQGKDAETTQEQQS